jgi:hypothetical protein
VRDVRDTKVEIPRSGAAQSARDRRLKFLDLAVFFEFFAPLHFCGAHPAGDNAPGYNRL